jgi:hypothetical protein
LGLLCRHAAIISQEQLHCQDNERNEPPRRQESEDFKDLHAKEAKESKESKNSRIIKKTSIGLPPKKRTPS